MDATKKLLRLPQVIEKTGLSRSTLYSRIKVNAFPRPISLNPAGRGAVAWPFAEVEKWITERIEAARLPL